MESALNPYEPNAGSLPSEIAGRDKILTVIETAIQRKLAMRNHRSIVLHGHRGMGKTVLLKKCKEICASKNLYAVWMEISIDNKLNEGLLRAFQKLIIDANANNVAKNLLKRAASALLNFIKKHQLSIHFASDAIGSIAVVPMPGLADSGNLEYDLLDLIDSVSELAKLQKKAIVLLIDELHEASKQELRTLCLIMHHCNNHDLPVLLIAAGLPQLSEQLYNAKTYAERLFTYFVVDLLNEKEVNTALIRPAHSQNVFFVPLALKQAYTHTGGYPYFVQQWGESIWNSARKSPITEADVKKGFTDYSSYLSEFFKNRIKKLTLREKNYIRAMTQLGDGPFNTSVIAQTLGKQPESLTTIRAHLIKKLILYSNQRGQIDFTAPLFAQFIREEMG